MRYVFDTKDVVHYRFPTHTNDLVMDRSDAETSEVFMVVLEPGEAPPLHVHHDTEQVFHVLRGAGTLQIGEEPAERFPVVPGNVVRIPRGTLHRIFCEGNEPLEYLSVDCFVGGRPTDEPTWDSHVHVMCEKNGWDYNKVR